MPPDTASDNNEEITSAAYTLHYFPFSLYSIMARYTAVLGASTLSSPAEAPSIHVKLVNMHYEALDNLSESFLRDVNPKGLIPVLSGGRLTAPMPESLDISYFLAREHFPALLPERHRATIEDLLRRLHSFEAFSICCRVDDEEVGEENPNEAVGRLLKSEGISDAYRAALEAKMEWHNATLGVALRPENIREAKQKAQSLLADVLQARKKFGGEKGSGIWIFGDDVGPTVLDGHIVPFVARMVDVERQDLVPPELLEAAQKAMETPEWLQVMHGRRTWYDRSYGPVSQLKEI